MRRALRATVVAALTMAMALATPFATAVRAQDGTSGAFCTLLTAEEVGTALNLEMTQGASSPTDCNWDADFEAGVFSSLNVRHEQGDIASGARIVFPEGVDIEVGGRPAFYAADATILYIELAEGGMLVLQLVGTPGEGVDPQAALTGLAELAMPRLATITIPGPETPEPQPSLTGDPELIAMFPDEIAGQPVDAVSMTGAEMLGIGNAEDPDTEAAIQQVNDALAPQGKSIEDLSVAFATVFSGNAVSSVSAVRVKGADMGPVAQAILPLFLTALDDPQQTPGEVAGKSVTIVTDGPNTPDSPKQYLYVKDDVMWMVGAGEPDLTEIFQQLP